MLSQSVTNLEFEKKTVPTSDISTNLRMANVLTQSKCWDCDMHQTEIVMLKWHNKETETMFIQFMVIEDCASL